jgi:hypothetical protein
MPLPVRFHPDALLELKDGAAFYSAQSAIFLALVA